MKDKLLNLLQSTTFKSKTQLETKIDNVMFSSDYTTDTYKLNIHIIRADYFEATYYVTIAWIENDKLNMINKNIFVEL